MVTTHVESAVMFPGRRVPALFFAAMVCFACNDDTTSEVCSIDAPVRLLAPPDGWQPDEHGWNFKVHRFDDRLLYGFSADGEPTDVFLRDLCGGEPERVLKQTSDIHTFGVVEFAEVGPMLVGARGNDYFLVDRLDVAGADTPRRVEDLDPHAGVGGLITVEYWPTAIVFSSFHPGEQSFYSAAAGVGAASTERWTFGPPPGASAVHLGKSIVNFIAHDDGMWVHTDDGRVRLYDPGSARFTDVVSGARWAMSVKLGDREFMVVQDIGDDEAEAVRLVDLSDGTTRPVTINSFTQGSFGRDPEHPFAGRWVSVVTEKGAAIALQGPEGGLIEAYDVETLTPIAVPANTGPVFVREAPWFGVTLPDSGDTVVAAWDPFTGTVEEKYRGAAFNPYERKFEWDDGMVKFRDEIEQGVYRLSRVEPDTRTTTVEIPRIGAWWRDIGDGRLLTYFRLDSWVDTLLLIDAGTGEATTLVDATHWWAYEPELGALLYTDFSGDEPGLWAMPIAAR